MILKNMLLTDYCQELKAKHVTVPAFAQATIKKASYEAPTWLHLGAGNLFKGYHAVLSQKMLDEGFSTTGIIVAVAFDEEVVEKIYRPHDNLILQVVMKADGSLEKRIINSVTESLVMDAAYNDAVDWHRLETIFASKSLQMVTISITEKGYKLTDIDGHLRGDIVNALRKGPQKTGHAMLKLAALMLHRFKNGAAPIALVSTDNFSHNGTKLQEALTLIATAWQQNRSVSADFCAYLANPQKVGFPWSMIDKITPHPSEKVQKSLEALGFKQLEVIKTTKGSVTAPFVNTEECEYLVIEDLFPNGRPALEKVGVYFTDRETVDKVEKMKVCTCLNPLHTTLAIFGHLLGYKSIAEEMASPLLNKLVTKMGYEEGMPVVVDPKIIDPQVFMAEVLTKRLPNPNIPDTPERIATDTSQKLAIRFGETIKTYHQDPKLEVKNLNLIALTIAAWCRYLMGLDDEGKVLTLSADPLLPELRAIIKAIEFKNVASTGDHLKPILTNKAIFGVDLFEVGLGPLITSYFSRMIAAEGAIEALLEEQLN